MKAVDLVKGKDRRPRFVGVVDVDETGLAVVVQDYKGRFFLVFSDGRIRFIAQAPWVPVFVAREFAGRLEGRRLEGLRIFS